MVTTKKNARPVAKQLRAIAEHVSTDSIAHFAPVVRFFIYVAAALAISGLGVIGLLAIELYLYDVSGLIGFIVSMAVDALVIYGLVCHEHVNF